MSDARATVIVEGPDAVTYLHSQVSQDVASMNVGDQRWTFVLEPTGKVTALARMTRVAHERFVLDVEADALDALVARLSRFKIRVKADITAGEPVAPVYASDAERIEAGWPAMGAEIVSGETIPAETGVVDEAVVFTKGCYPGQELVERMDSRGSTAPRFVRKLVASAEMVAGSIISLDGKDVGRVTSSAGSVALGVVHRSVEPGSEVQLDGGATATVLAAR
jgi:tRNA-modifying protein YgfZ